MRSKSQILLSPAILQPGKANSITAFILTAVGRDEAVSQWRLVSEIGIAVGLLNSYVKRFTRKGLLKVLAVPHRRFSYYLTPKGFAGKSRLTAEYLSTSLLFFRLARLECAEVMEFAISRGWSRLALAGADDLCEIAVLCALEKGIRIAGIIDPAQAGGIFAGVPVVENVAHLLSPVDACIVAAIAPVDPLLAALRDQVAPDRLLAPPMLGLKDLCPPLKEAA